MERTLTKRIENDFSVGSGNEIREVAGIVRPTLLNTTRRCRFGKIAAKTLLLILLSTILASVQAANRYADPDYWGSKANGGHYPVKSKFTASVNYATGYIDIAYFNHDAGYFDHASLGALDVKLSYRVGDSNKEFFRSSTNQDGDEIERGHLINGVVGTWNKDGTIRVHLRLNDETKGISRIYLSCKLQANGGKTDQQSAGGSIDISINQLGLLKISDYGFFDPSTARLNWSSDSNKLSTYSMTTLYDGTDGSNPLKMGSVGYDKSTKTAYTSGSFAVVQNTKPHSYYLRQVVNYSGSPADSITLQSEPFTVPAFTHPTSLTGSYNSATNKLDLTWKIPKASGDVDNQEVVTVGFKLQRATKADFSDAVNINLSAIGYNPDKDSYSYSDDIHANVYYRLARDYTRNENWGWKDSVGFTFDQAHAVFDTSAHLQLTLDNDQVQATLQWAPGGVWSDGAVFNIIRYNKSNGTSSTYALSNDDYFKGKYVDSLIVPCNEYYYALQIIPAGGSGYKSLKPLQTGGTVTAVKIGNITGLSVSKGYYQDRTELSWTANGVFDNFIITRKAYGNGASSGKFIQIGTASSASFGTVQYTDKNAEPGVYYEYQVYGRVNCNNIDHYSDSLLAVGFRSPTGNIYGRVTFGNGQAVSEVAVRLQATDNILLGQSMAFTGGVGSQLVLDSLTSPLTDSAFSIELWVKSVGEAPVNQVLFSRAGQYELGYNGSGKLYFSYLNQTLTSDSLLPAGVYYHIAAVHGRDSSYIVLNDQVIALSHNSGVAASGILSKKILIGASEVVNGRNFKGNLDELRIWNIARPSTAILRDYSRLLTGNEHGLIGYWRFDETIMDQFYDIANKDGAFYMNNGVMDPAFVSHSAAVPSADQLSLKAFSDSAGNYMISGIPYTANGPTYTIVPLLGTHRFSPNTVNRLLSDKNNSFTVDFTDQSSFPVSGTVYYRNSTVPVQGAMFTVDGQYAQKVDGSPITTASDGTFEISVPIGIHEVKVLKSNHGFTFDGKIINLDGSNRNYQDPLSGLLLYDTTTIRFIGRVAGGTIQDSLPLGHSVSKNNLGDNLKLTLQLTGEANREIFHSGTDSTVLVDHFLPSDPARAEKNYQTKVVYGKNTIDIYPDLTTGEFFADIIPESFVIVAASSKGHENFIQTAESIDFTNAFITNKDGYSYQDSVLNAKGEYVTTNYTDSVPFNASYKAILRVNPVLTYAQLGKKGERLSYLGDSLIYINDALHTNTPVRVYKGAAGTPDAGAAYLFNHAVFTQTKAYKIDILSYEAYVYNGQDDGKNPVDKVPSQGAELTITNELDSEAGAGSPVQLPLDSLGHGVYSFIAGEPQTTDEIGLKRFSISETIGKQVTQAAPFSAYILGFRPTGSDFVTAGPDKVLYVLRDPPGANSYASLAKGTVFSSTDTYTGMVANSGDITIKNKITPKLITWTGIGGGLIFETDPVFGTEGTVQHSEAIGGSTSTTKTTTLLTAFSTSSAPLYVGTPGDLYIGNSTNIVCSNTFNLQVVAKADYNENTDIRYFEGTDYDIVMRTGIAIGQRFNTMFAYPQRFIEERLIPNLNQIKNSVLRPVGSVSDGQALADATGQNVYVSKLSKEDPDYGKSNADVNAFGKDAENLNWTDGRSYKVYVPKSLKNPTDTILLINQSIQNWVDRMADNERDKITAAHNKPYRNYSFTGGSNITESYQFDINKHKDVNFTFVLGGGFTSEGGFEQNGAGITVTVKELFSTEQGGDFTKDTTFSDNFGFTLSENGKNYVSTDVFQAEDGSYLFSTKGGVTSCPYERADYSKYYQPGTLLNQPTVQAEKPGITVENPVVSNVPSNKTAAFTVHLLNESESHADANYLLYVPDETNPNGAKITMDGSVLGSGRVVYMPVTAPDIPKTIILERGPDSMDYNNIQLVLMSDCDTSVYAVATISAHFIPSCSEVNIKSPTDQFVVNTLSPVDSANSHYLPVHLDGFDVNHSLFDHIEIQYKPAADAIWTTAVSFYANKERYDPASGMKQMIAENGVIDYNLVMNDASFSDQVYNIRAVSFCMENGQVVSTSQSDILTGIKDTYNPRLFGSPQPANGVLGIGDNIMLRFNEPIAGGLLSRSDFQVTGIRNGSFGDHRVSVSLNGSSGAITSEFAKNFTDKNITAEIWVLPGNGNASAGSRDQTIFSQGNLNSALELTLTADQYLQVKVGDQIVKSDNPLKVEKGSWAHVALEYNAMDKTVAGFYNFEEVIHPTPVGAYAGIGPLVFGKSQGGVNQFFAGKMHEARVWSKLQPVTALQMQSLMMLSGAEEGLLAYYPMTEGRGGIIYDKARGDNARLKGDWSTPAGKAAALKGNGYVKINTGSAVITSSMDYTLQLWFKATPGQTDATIISNGKGDGMDFGGSLNQFNLGFDGGVLTYTNNGLSVRATGNYLDDSWHQVTLTVNHVSGVGQLYIDGTMNTYFDAGHTGGITAPYAFLGARVYTDSVSVGEQRDRYFKGSVDEVRLWNTYMPASVIEGNVNTRLDGTEGGLLAYYPFEHYINFQNVQQMDATLSDQVVQLAGGQAVPDAVLSEAEITGDMAPIKDKGPVANLQFNYVVNQDQLLINLTEPRQSVDHKIITFSVSNVRDVNGNALRSPVTWTAYINQNPLSWSEDSISLVKDENKALQFTSYIVNNGGTVQNYRILNLPSWLQASPRTGSVGPLARQAVNFTVNPGVNVGSYDEVAYMLNDNNQSQALPMMIRVAGKEPDWNVNPSEYAYSMTVIGNIRINQIFSTDSSDKLAAFVNGNCVGVTKNAYNASNDLWYTYLTIYSNSRSGETPDFRIWDASTGKIYQGQPSQPVSFNNDAIIGAPDQPVIFDGKEMLIQNIALDSGWNWVSFNLAGPGLSRVGNFLANGSWQSGDMIKNDQGFAQYGTSLGWVGSLEAISNNSLYMLLSGQKQVLSINGTPVDLAQTRIPVKAKSWNYISYLPIVNMTVKEALADYNAQKGDVLKSQTGFAMYDDKIGWIGNLTFMEPGKGYMLYRTAGPDESFRYGSLGGSLGSVAPGRAGGLYPVSTLSAYKQATPGLHQQQYPLAANYKYAENMTLLAVVDSSVRLQPGDKILAYVGSELRASATQFTLPSIVGADGRNAKTDAPVFLFNIAGSRPDGVYFKLERQGRIVASSGAVFNYAANRQLGAVDQPYVLRFTTGERPAKVTLFPNPFNSEIQLNMELEPVNGQQRHTIGYSVFDISGRLIYRSPDKEVLGNTYRTTWKTRDQRDANPGADIPSGVYLIRVTVDGKSETFKVIKR